MREGSITTGKVYYDTGELYFEGTYYDDAWHNLYPWQPLDLITGVSYYRNGNKYREGKFQRAGLLEGKEYYESGVLKFDGVFNDKRSAKSYTINGILINEKGEVSPYGEITVPRNYYGPSYPIEGKYYSEDGELIYEGKFKVIHRGSLGYPQVVFPEGYGSLG
ncbi:MAG: hypothetical protein LUF29_03205 [Oscillospiraceae bacterium]|nr:hypothetical protein [Oscillospiraceae bacterium]